MSSRQRPATANQEPQFQRKHGGASRLGLTLKQGNKMSSTDDTKPAAKSGRRNRKGEARRQKASSAETAAPVEMQTPELEQKQVPQADPETAVSEPLEAVVAEASGRQAQRMMSFRPKPPRWPKPAGRAGADRTFDRRTLACQPADHRQRLSRLHQEIIRAVRVVFRAAQRRSLARQGDGSANRIREAGLRKFGRRSRRKSANFTASLPGKPSNRLRASSARHRRRTENPDA